MADYSSYGFNKYLQAINGYVSTRPKKITGVEFESQFDVQLKKIRTSRVDIKDFVHNSNRATATGSFNTGEVLYLTTTLSPKNEFKNDPNFAVPFLAVYQGSPSGTSQIFPGQSSSIGTGTYRVSGELDLSYDGTNTVWKGTVENVSAGAVSITLITQWKYLFYNAGTSAE
jgi:hypothetical protein